MVLMSRKVPPAYHFTTITARHTLTQERGFITAEQTQPTGADPVRELYAIVAHLVNPMTLASVAGCRVCERTSF
tara:strand:+ start:359 stop:580 length:222 start_codon:yes stop_codon:yes gene_type:complete